MTTLVYRVNSKIRRRVEPRLHDFSDCDCETDTCEALKAQNGARCSTDCSMPVWDDDLAAKARKKARSLAQDDSLDRDLVHLGKRSNIYVSAHNPSIEDAVNAWAAEEEMRNERSNGQVPNGRLIVLSRGLSTLNRLQICVCGIEPGDLARERRYPTADIPTS
ncbi:hypothetical protein AC579_898 [Pseudocercospora musae]|uniref:SCP domain-containing protein n=1 Tax=Pseudocercospora musae TaxID=113226 RepID=A0A139INB5_9PEZI|nr:hypothetical protein AC579_898 [Pseudocercospora musae]